MSPLMPCSPRWLYLRWKLTSILASYLPLCAALQGASMSLFGRHFRSYPAQDAALAGVGDAEQSRGLSADVLLAEFTKLAREIADRTKHQHTLLNISIVSSGAIASFVLTKTSDRVLTIRLAYLSSVLGALWLDHGRAIANIGIYLTRSPWPQLRQVSHNDTLSTRED